jgi:hypothetical protein
VDGAFGATRVDAPHPRGEWFGLDLLEDLKRFGELADVNVVLIQVDGLGFQRRRIAGSSPQQAPQQPHG